jgi:hypothetical protein
VLFAVVLAAAAPVAAQSVVNPSLAEFTPSADHDAVANGVPVVTRYELEIFQQGQTSAVRTIGLGKPAPAADGKIRVDFANLLTSPLTAGVVYTADVVAVGPGGRAASALSLNAFSFAAAAIPCSYAPSVLGESVAAGGGSGTIGVTSGSGCAWTATENAGWLTITNGASGTGSGSVRYSATANTSTSPRTATLMIAGIAVTISQAGVACSYGVSAGQNVAAGGGSAAVTVSAPAGCAWTAAESSGWLTIASGSSGSGNGTVSVTATANTATASRVANITVAGQIIGITQAGVDCSYNTSATAQNFAANGGSASVTVSAGTGCAWTATESASWLTISSGATGSGNGTVTFSATANTATASRTATLTAAGRAISITQAAAACSYAVSPTNPSLGSAGGNASLTVTTTTGCNWTATESASWLTITSGASGTKTGMVSYRATANSSSNARTADISVAGRTVTVRQSGTSGAPPAPENLHVVTNVR